MDERDRQSPKSLLKQLAPQLTLLGFCALLYTGSLLGLIPAPAKLNADLLGALKAYGLPLIAFCALLENIVGLSVYFPGAFTIVTGMALTAGDLQFAIVTYFAIYIPSYCGNWISYLFGRKEGRALGRERVEGKHESLLFTIAYCHPQFAALKAFSSGLQRRSARWFLRKSLPVSLVWSVLYAVLIYNLGLNANFLSYMPWLFLIYLVAWTAWDTIKFFKRPRF